MNSSKEVSSRPQQAGHERTKPAAVSDHTVPSALPGQMGPGWLGTLIETAVARLNDVLIVTQVDGTNEIIVYVSPAITFHSGYAPDEVVGRSPRMFQGPDTSRATLDRIRAAVDARLPIRAELLNYAKDGTQYWIEIDIAPILDAKGQATHMVSVQRDITEQKRNHEALQSKDRRFVLALEASANAVWEWTILTGAVEYRDEIPGRSWRGQNHGARQGKDLRVLLDLIHPDDRDRVEATLFKTIAGKDSLKLEEYRLRRPDGSYANISDRQFIMRFPDGTAECLIGSMLDVSEKHELENRRHQAQRLELLGEMTGGIAHNFNNLLTVILGSIDLLRQNTLPAAKVETTLTMIDEAAQRGAALTQHLMSFSKAKSLTLQSVDLGRLMDQVRPVWSNLLLPRIRLQVRSDRRPWPVISDKVHLEAVMLNLVINARDAMPDGGELLVEVENTESGSDLIRVREDEEPARYVMITVTDNGVGMTPEQIKAAFDPFFTTKPPGEGTGLGLSSAYGFLNQSGGFIRLQSTPGQGTTVRIFLKAADEEPEPEIVQTPGPIPVDGSHRILVVDDDPLVREYVRALLTSLGYQVIIAVNGEDALRLLATDSNIDLLFTDILMDGGMNGWELARCALALFPHLRILFTSAFPDAVEPPLPHLPEVKSLLRKPYRPRDLSAAITQALARAGAPGTLP